MDKLLSSVQKNKNRRHNNKQTKKKQQQQLKVVYISNPVRFSTSAAKFRALVQELTGQDADDMTPEQPMFPVAHDGGGAGRGEGSSWQKDVGGDGIETVEDNHHVLQVPTSIHHHPGTATSSSENSNLLLEDPYVPELQENFPDGIFPSNMWYESI